MSIERVKADHRVTWGLILTAGALCMGLYCYLAIQSEFRHFQERKRLELDLIAVQIESRLSAAISQLQMISLLPGVGPQTRAAIESVRSEEFVSLRIERVAKRGEVHRGFDIVKHCQEIPVDRQTQTPDPFDASRTWLLRPVKVICKQSQTLFSGIKILAPWVSGVGDQKGFVSGVILDQKLQESLGDPRLGEIALENKEARYRISKMGRELPGGLFSSLPGALVESVAFDLGSGPPSLWSIEQRSPGLLFWEQVSTQHLVKVLLIQALVLSGVFLLLFVSRRKLAEQKTFLLHEMEVQGNELRLQHQLNESYQQLKEAQSQLVHSEKMASLGVIAAGIAHEINNPLSYVMSNTEMLEKNLNSIEARVKSEAVFKNDQNIEFLISESGEMTAEILEGAKRIRDTVQGLRHFSRLDDAEYRLTDINECIETTLKFLSNELKHGCKVEKEMELLPESFCYPGQLIQVFTNLILNAVQAMEGVGTIRIVTRRLEGNAILVSIKDSGPGIKKKDMEQIFTPFFTTKPQGKGTGLGLSISYGIIQKHEGKIEVHSQEGMGAEFNITLPIKESVG